MENLIISLGTDCTLFHGFKEYFGYVHRENGVATSPFAGTWIYDPHNRPGDWRMNYNSLGIVADIIDSDFKGWNEYKINFRGKLCLRNHPVEFTHPDSVNTDSPALFYEKLRGSQPIIFCSVWRVYIAFDKPKADIFPGLKKFESAIKKINPDLKYRMAFFFVVDRKPEQIEYVKKIMHGRGIKYGLLYNEIDPNPNRKYKQKFDASGWKQALIDTGVKP